MKVNKNRELIDELVKYLPKKRNEINSKTIWVSNFYLINNKED